MTVTVTIRDNLFILDICAIHAFARLAHIV